MDTTTEPRLMTVKQAAAYMAIGMRTLERLAAGGEIAVVRVGRAVRYSRDDVDAWIDSRRCPTLST